MEKIYYISTEPQFFGDVTEEEAELLAERLAERARGAFPRVKFVVVSGQRRHQLDEDGLAEIQEFINDNWYE